MWNGEGRLGLAVSGGPDSLGLLLLAQALLPGRIAAATVDHGLRADSAAEAECVARTCAQLGVAHSVLGVQVDPGNLQSQARAARYTALADWMRREDLAALCTAHHADDQAETMLLRLNRASGVAGLAGVRARALVPGARQLLLRPLLQFRRTELASVVEAAGLAAAADPSNTDDRFDRARIRKAIAGANWLDVPALAASAAHLADADAALDWAAEREWAECVTKAPMGLIYRPQAPRAVALRVITRIVAELGGEAPRGSAAARVFDALVAHQPASIGNLVARSGIDGWNFTKAPKRRA
ncbi:MAG: tRNA lysidine(34) synthetase TilS [Novosphingobium sp.]|uniref:tRNA lysidine(34) synthetase TilS n=1 Tax=Novosphingobium sp. TaxID=1874826 RepID=UPI0032BD1413